jgi:hypothetical protein
MLVKNFANTATAAYMNAREARYLCTVAASNLHEIHRLFSLASKCDLSLGRVQTFPSNIYIDNVLIVRKGDCAAEFMGRSENRKKEFMDSILSLGEAFSATITSPEMTMVRR